MLGLSFCMYIQIIPLDKHALFKQELLSKKKSNVSVKKMNKITMENAQTNHTVEITVWCIKKVNAWTF